MDMRAAMRAKRADETRLIRSILAAVDDAQAVPTDQTRSNGSHMFGDGSAEVPRLKLSEDQLRTVLTGEMVVRRPREPKCAAWARTSAPTCWRRRWR
jgi:hypothetical protein